MEKFTNANIKREKKRLNRNIIICIIILVVGIAFGFWTKYKIDDANKNIKNLNDVIMSEDENKEEKIVTLNVQSIPYCFAVQDGNVNSYYIVMDEQYMYIAYLTPADFNMLNKEEIKENPIEIKGVTKLTSLEIKKLAIEAYNESVEEEYKITLADFNNYFGEIYLDTSVSINSGVAGFQEMCFFVLSFAGIISIIITVVQRVKFSKNIKKMDEYEIEKLDKEMNAEDAFYYEKAHLYLTEHYIINFNGTFKIIKYEDIIWMYAMIYRTNGIKTNQSIKVMTKDGKTYEIASVSMVTKANKEIYNEISNTIRAKNNSIILGYTKEAAEQAKERIEK